MTLVGMKYEIAIFVLSWKDNRENHLKLVKHGFIFSAMLNHSIQAKHKSNKNSWLKYIMIGREHKSSYPQDYAFHENKNVSI